MTAPGQVVVFALGEAAGGQARAALEGLGQLPTLLAGTVAVTGTVSGMGLEDGASLFLTKESALQWLSQKMSRK